MERTKAVDKPKPTKSGYELGTLTLPGIETAKPLTEEEEQKRYRISERLVKAIFEEETRTLLNAKQYGGWVVEVEQLTVERTFAAAYKFISQVAPSCGGGNYRKLSDDTLRDYRSVHVEWDAVREFVGDDALFNALNLKGFKAELKKLDEKRKKQALADGQAGGDKCGEGEGDGEGGGLDAVAKRKAKADRKQRQLWQKVEKAIGAVYDNATTEAKYLDFDAIDKDANYCSEKALSVKTLRP